MRIHFLRAGKLAEDLAADQVSAHEQALYLALSFLVWNLAYYLFVIPSKLTEGPFFWWLWVTEFSFVALFTVTGVLFCLRKCRIEPRRNFLLFFSCLYLPVSITTLVVVWGLFHLMFTLPLMFVGSPMPEWLLYLPWLGSDRVYDIAGFFAYVGMTFAIFLRVGEHMERISNLKESANSSAQPTTASGRS